MTAVFAATGSLWVVLADPGTGAAARTWYVSPGGSDGGTGYADDPLLTIDKAVRRATDGDTVRVAAGVYHESVQVYGESIRIVGAGPGETVLDGARPVTGFSTDGDGRYSAAWNTSFQRTVYNSSVPHVLPDRPEAGWPEQFFLDGVALTEVPSRDDVAPGAFFHDVSSGRVVLGDDPTGRLVEGSDLSWGLYLNHADGSTVEQLSINRFATEERHMAALRAYADDLVVKDVEIRDNARIGLSMIGDRIEALRVDAIDNGYMGMHGHFASEVSVIDSVINGNNTEVFDAWHASAGMKITESHDILFAGNTVNDNHGPGFWTDLSVSDVVVRNNYFRDNLRSGVELELSSEVIVVDNVMTGNGEQGVWVLESSQVDVWHNYLAGNERGVWILDGPRSDVDHVRVGNNVITDPSNAKMLLAVDDWTEERNASEMRVVLDGNRYWTASGTTGLVRWANWPASLTIAGDLQDLRSATGQEQHGVAASGATNPFSSAQLALVPVPTHVQDARSSASDVSPGTTSPATTDAPPAEVPAPASTAPPAPVESPVSTEPPAPVAPPVPVESPAPVAPPAPVESPAPAPAPTTTDAPTTDPVDDETPFDRGGWTAPATVDRDSRPVRGAVRSVADTDPVAATTDAPAPAMPAETAPAEAGAPAVGDASLTDLAGWRSFAEQLAQVLGAA